MHVLVLRDLFQNWNIYFYNMLFFILHYILHYFTFLNINKVLFYLFLHVDLKTHTWNMFLNVSFNRINCKIMLKLY